MNNEEITNGIDTPQEESGILNKQMDRRDFIRTSAIAMAGLFLASCSVDPSKISASESDPFDENVRELNSQFETKKEFFLSFKLAI